MLRIQAFGRPQTRRRAEESVEVRLCDGAWGGRHTDDGVVLGDVVEVLDVFAEQHIDAGLERFVADDFVAHQDLLACGDIHDVAGGSVVVAEEHTFLCVGVCVGGLPRR